MSDLVGIPEDQFSHNEANLCLRVVPELIRGRVGSTRFFLERVGGSGRNFFLWVGGSEKNSNSCLVGSLSSPELIN